MPLKRITKFLFFLFTFACCLLYLMGAATAWLNSPAWWGFNFAGLLFPILLVVIFITGIIWLFINKGMSILCLLVLLAGWQTIFDTFGLHPSNKSDNMYGLTIMSYNVRNFHSLSTRYAHSREDFTNLISLQNADIICMQEFITVDLGKNTVHNNIPYFQKNLQRPYYYFANDQIWDNGLGVIYHYGSIIYSRFPFVDTGKIMIDDEQQLSLIYADIVPGRDTIRVMTMHLQSFGLNAGDYAGMHPLIAGEKNSLEASRSVMYKLRKGFSARENQALIVNRAIASSPYPVIVCGDFNTTPASTTYHTMRGNLQDAFLQKGFGLGRTYYRLSPTLRIDYIFADPRFSVNSFNVIYHLASDHYPVVANISLK